MRRRRLVVVVIGATLVLVGCSQGQGPRTTATDQPQAAVGAGGAGANLKTDEEFVPDVALKIVAAIELSRMALARTANPEIRSFAQLIIGGHTVAGDKLKSIISGRSMAWPGQLDDSHRKSADELAKKQGADFDRDYLTSMVKADEDLAAKLESRLDVQSLQEWKTAAAARTQSRAMPSSKPDMEDVKVRPSQTDNATTAKINDWAAETYPVAQKLLDTARTLETAIKKHPTN